MHLQEYVMVSLQTFSRMLIQHWHKQFINIAEEHSVHRRKGQELFYFDHTVHSQVPLRTPVLHDATKLDYRVQLTHVQPWLSKCQLNPCLWCHAPMTLETSHLCIHNRASLTKYSNRCLCWHTSVPQDTWQQQEGSKPCIHTTVLVLTTLRCLRLLDRRASHETHTKSTCSTQVIARASAQLCLYWLQLRASIFSIHVPHMKPTVTLRATHTRVSRMKPTVSLRVRHVSSPV